MYLFLKFINQKLFFLTLIIFMLLSGCQNWAEKELLNLSLENNFFQKPSLIKISKIGGDGYDWGPALLKLNNQIFLAGSTFRSFGDSTDFIVAKLSDTGKIIAAKTFGGNNKDLLEGISYIKNEDILLYGTSQSMFFTPMPGVYEPRPIVMKIDKELNIKWVQEFNEFFSKILSIEETSDNNLIAVGYKYLSENSTNNYCTLIIKLDNNGKQVWAKMLNKDQYNLAEHITKFNQNTLHIFGEITQDKQSSLYSLLLTKDDAIKYFLTFKTQGKSLNAIKNIKCNDGGIILLGAVLEEKNNKNILLIKLNKDFNIEWAKKYSSKHQSIAYDIIENDKGYLLTGYTGLEDKDYDGLLIQVDFSGKLINFEVIGSPLTDIFTQIIQLNDGTYLFCGITTSEKDKTSDFILGQFQQTNEINKYDPENNDLIVSSIEIIKQALQVNLEDIILRQREIPTTALDKITVVK